MRKRFTGKVIIGDTKRCPECEQYKEFDNFRKGTHKHGLSAYCIECNVKICNERRNKINPDRKRQRSILEVKGDGINKIYLTKGKVAIVDKEDYEKVIQYTWNYGKHGYASTSLCNPKRMLLMHRLIINAPDNKHVDHIDGNTLNNCKSNLRLCSVIENCRHRTKLSSHNTSGKTGVDFDKKSNKWRSRITINKQEKIIGYYDCYADAILARMDAEDKYFKEFKPTV